jgi:hypothetical protein
MQDHGDRRILLLGRMITALETTCGAGENDFRHGDPLTDLRQSTDWSKLQRLSADKVAREKGD